MGKLMDAMDHFVANTKYNFEVNKPEIYIGIGIAGIIGAGIMACRATLKLNKTLTESREHIEEIHEKIETGEIPENKARQQVALGYIYMGARVVWLYAPSVILGGCSIATIVASHNELKRRASTFASLYSASEKAFKEYRQRVADRFGKEVEQEIYTGKNQIEDKEKKVDENGNAIEDKKETDKSEAPLYSEYARIYDDGCKGWTKDPEANMIFLRRQQDAMTDRLRAKGHLYLNEVYTALGFPETEAGHYVGWIDDESLGGDCFVDFGIFDEEKMDVNSNFINGRERNIVLDFNVDGPIVDKVWCKKNKASLIKKMNESAMENEVCTFRPMAES